MIAMEDEPLIRATAGEAASNMPSQIEVKIAATRAELGDIIGALERKLAPRQLLDSGVVMLKDVIVSEASRLSQLARPTAAVSAGRTGPRLAADVPREAAAPTPAFA